MKQIIMLYRPGAASLPTFLFYLIFPFLSIQTYLSYLAISLPFRVFPSVPRYRNFPYPLTEIFSPEEGV